METLVDRERAAHWYYPNGGACHTVPDAKGNPRRATLADARKLGLFPSVTSILSIKAKHGLEAWKLEQAILAALTLPRGSEESLDAFAKRVVKDMDAQAEKAAQWGTRLHEEAEAMHATGVLIQRDDTYPFLKGYEAWFKENITKVYFAEHTIVNRVLGYAGRLDLCAEHALYGRCVIDLKTQKVKAKAQFYPEWEMQLAAYREGLPPSFANSGLISVVIDSENPAEVATQLWESAGRALTAFCACLHLWQHDRKYTPFRTTQKQEKAA